MCSVDTPPPPTKEKPSVLVTARDGIGGSPANAAAGRKKLRIDLNKSTSNAYGSSLVIPE